LPGKELKGARTQGCNKANQKQIQQQFSAVEKIRIILEGLKGKIPISGDLQAGRHYFRHLIQMV